MTTDPHVAIFEAHRARLVGLAYRMLGEVSEAQDVVQDAYLRWREQHDVRRPEAWLTTVVTRLCLNRLESARARRESLAGQWLPEPVATGAGVLGPVETAEQRESVSIGLLVLLERLSPPERAVFVLHEAFGYRHAEIAKVLEVNEAHCRQLLRRARRRLADGRRRFSYDRQRHAVLLERFFAASLRGDLQGLQQLLADDVVAWADGDGEHVARRPVVGASKVARYLVGIARRGAQADRMEFLLREVNGALAVVGLAEGEVAAVCAADVIDIEPLGPRVSRVYLMVAPRKLRYALAE